MEWKRCRRWIIGGAEEMKALEKQRLYVLADGMQAFEELDRSAD
jgi:hypothetical protein